MSILKKLFDHEYKELRRFTKIADQVMALEEEYSKLTDTELQNKTEEFTILFLYAFKYFYSQAEPEY